MARTVYLILGWFFVAIGLIGAFLPILPTVPFLILAAACFSRGSERAYAWLLNLPVYGRAVKKWQETRSIPLRAKILSTLILIVSMGTSIVLFVPVLIGKVVMAAFGVGVIVFIWVQKTAK